MSVRRWLLFVPAALLIVSVVPLLLAAGVLKPLLGSALARVLGAWELSGLAMVPALYIWLRAGGRRTHEPSSRGRD